MSLIFISIVCSVMCGQNKMLLNKLEILCNPPPHPFYFCEFFYHMWWMELYFHSLNMPSWCGAQLKHRIPVGQSKRNISTVGMLKYCLTCMRHPRVHYTHACITLTDVQETFFSVALVFTWRNRGFVHYCLFLWRSVSK
jgi:hypothetical protein